MTCRKWMVRGLVFSVLGGIAAAALAYQAWTNPTATRRQVLGQLEKSFVGAHVNLESARLRLLGGISFSDLRMTRRDDLDRTDFLYVPDGIIYHDKERLANGDIAIRKIELHRVRLRIVRDRDGHWNLANLLGPVDPSRRVPMLVFQQATIVLEDHTTAQPGPLLEIKDVNLTVINDPLPTLTFEGTGTTDVIGPVRLAGKLQRTTGETALDVDASAIPVGPALVERFAAFAPDAAAHIRNLRGEGRIKAAVALRPGSAQPWSYDATVLLTKGEFSHARLPWNLQDAEASVHVVNGSIPVAHVTARSGPTKFDMTLKDVSLSLPPGYSIKDDGSVLTDLVREIDARFEHVHVEDKLFDLLPDTLKPFNVDYKPNGYLTMTHTFRKKESGRWEKRFLLSAEDMQMTYRLFPYTVDHVTGTLDIEYDNEIQPSVKLDLLGRSRERMITLKGSALAAKNNSFVDIDIAADKMPLDKKLFEALTPGCQGIVKLFHPDKSLFQPDKITKKGLDWPAIGTADFKVELRRQRGSPELSKSFFLKFHDATLCYDVFPYPLENISGELELLPDHWEAKNFRGTHCGGEISFSAHSQPLAANASVTDRPERVCVDLHGQHIRLDDPDFLAALKPRPALYQTWKTLNLAGRMNFDAKVVDMPGVPQEVDVGVSISGCQMMPEFFKYTMENVSGKFRYNKGCVDLDDVKATHGTSIISLKRGRIFVKPDAGGFQARLDEIRGWPVVPDEDFLEALPLAIREGLKAVKLHAPVYAETALIVDTGPNPDPHPLVWWDGNVTLRDATLQTGVEVSKIDGVVTCCGQQKGPDLQMVGHLALEQLSLLKQPIQDINARFYVLPTSPSILRVHDLTAKIFGGDIGGEGRIEFSPTFKYDTTLKALNVRLEDFGHYNFGNAADVAGPVCAALHLMGEGRDIGGLKGHGKIFVQNARLYKLPALLDLIKAFGLRLPDRTAFEQASATFSIDGPQMRVEQFDLIGNAISLRGQGTAGLNGDNLNLDFNADWARLGQFLPESVTEFPRAVSDQLLKVKVRGRIGDVHFTPELVPAITEPWKHVFGDDK